MSTPAAMLPATLTISGTSTITQHAAGDVEILLAVSGQTTIAQYAAGDVLPVLAIAGQTSISQHADGEILVAGFVPNEHRTYAVLPDGYPGY